MKNRKDYLKDYEAKRPGFLASRFSFFLCAVMNRIRPAKYRFLYQKSGLKGRQVLFLARHASYDDSHYVPLGCKPLVPNTLVGVHNIYKPFVFGLLLRDGVIPKPLYIPDLNTARNMMRLRKEGASFLIFPEGIQSTDGTVGPLNPSTAKMIKMLGLDTVLCTGHGAYLSNPRFDSNRRKGHVEYTFEKLFTKEELSSLSGEEIGARLREKIYYNEFAWNEKKQYKYKGKVPNATGVDNILFICPRCRGHFTMKVEGDTLCCKCGSRVKVDECYNLIPEGDEDFPLKRIDLWYKWQRTVMEEKTAKEGFEITCPVDHLTLNHNRFSFNSYKKLGEGCLTLSRDSLVYEGRDGGKETHLTFNIKEMPGIALVPGKGNHFYYRDGYHRFLIKGDGRLSAKLTMAVEILHNRVDDLWRKSYEDI